jgi:choline dehydrogenase
MVKDLPGVGENLQDHLQILLVFKTSESTLNDELGSFLNRMWVGIQYIFTRTGPLTLAASQVAIFTQSNANVARPDIQFHMQPLSPINRAMAYIRFLHLLAQCASCDL